MKSALSSDSSSWKGRAEQIRHLEDSLTSLKALLKDTETRSSSSRGSESDSSRSKDLKLRSQVAEVERDRLSEYVKVLSHRVNSAEDRAYKVEGKLREERRKTATLEQIVEKAQMAMRDNDRSSASAKFDSSSSSQQLVKANLEENVALQEEVEALTKELEVSRQRRKEDWSEFMKMASETRKMVEES